MPALKTFSICSQQHIVLLPPKKVPWTQDITVLHRAAVSAHFCQLSVIKGHPFP